jgi:hypothetical protein
MLGYRSVFGFKNICQINFVNRNLSKSVSKGDKTTKVNKIAKTTKVNKIAKTTKVDKTTKPTKSCNGCKDCKCNTNSGSLINFDFKEKQIDHNSLTWILTLIDKDSLKLTDNQIADYHGHSGGSWSWTNYQAKIIKDKGFNYWFYKTDGPLGYLTK